jgi:hypothetical protein
MVTRRTSKPAAPKKRTAKAAKSKADARPRTFWDDLADIGKSIPKEDLAFLPRDAAENFDDYLESGFFDN